jgi:hypothetical protein
VSRDKSRLFDAVQSVQYALLLAGLVVVTLVAGGCGGDDSSPSGEVGTSATMPSTAVETGATETQPMTTTVVEAPCSPRDFLPVLKKAFDDTAPKLRVVQARVERCRSGYAQVFAVPDKAVCEPGVAYCYETEQVFLGWQGDEWRILTSGTGITCGGGADTLRLIIRICGALGYPDLAVPSFQMPSKNIGCTLSAGSLRCDILSGLKPTPGEPCEFDWVGIVLARDGRAEPNCGSDTVYDSGAPVLPYGGTWRRAGFACESSVGGLQCTNQAGQGFTLARERWTTS